MGVVTRGFVTVDVLDELVVTGDVVEMLEVDEAVVEGVSVEDVFVWVGVGLVEVSRV